jgi:NAD(P)-dependent dehydrogenase (short-subunit alcohol dehydrogenase family)
MNFDGKVALVTGGASGLGQAAVMLLTGAGARVAVADVDEAAGAETVDRVTEAGGEAVFVRTDVTQEADVAGLVARVVDTWGRLDAAINNAGITGPYKFTPEYSLDEWNHVLAINLTGIFLGLKHEIPQMVRQGGGAIVNTSSGAGLIGYPGLPAYVASKHAVIGLTRSAGLEFATQGIRVNAVCPGSTLTPMLQGSMGDDPAARAAQENTTPMKRLGRPEEIAHAMVWLLSDEASFVNAHPFAVDGGAVAQ